MLLIQIQLSVTLFVTFFRKLAKMLSDNNLFFEGQIDYYWTLTSFTVVWNVVVSGPLLVILHLYVVTPV